MKRECRIFPDPRATHKALAEHFAGLARQYAALRGRFTVALAGGATPAGFYRLLAAEYADRVPWERVEVFFCDERFVPPDHPDSNYRLIRETLLDRVPVSADRVHPVPTVGLTLEAAAQSYQTLLLERFQGSPQLDWVLLGLGEDGHTASLFPGFEPPPQAWVAAVTQAPKPPRHRITLTYRTFNHARWAAFLVTGAKKAAIVARVVHGTDRLPARRIQPREGVCWYLDRAAAGRLWVGGKKPGAL